MHWTKKLWLRIEMCVCTIFQCVDSKLDEIPHEMCTNAMCETIELPMSLLQFWHAKLWNADYRIIYHHFISCVEHQLLFSVSVLWWLLLFVDFIGVSNVKMRVHVDRMAEKDRENMRTTIRNPIHMKTDLYSMAKNCPTRVTNWIQFFLYVSDDRRQKLPTKSP